MTDDSPSSEATDRAAHIPPREVPLADFPHSTVTTAGMRVLEADLTPVFGTARLNVPYATKSGRTLTLQVLLPPMDRGSVEPFPTLVYVQGSAWFEQNLGTELPGLAEFTRRGYVVAIVQYRPSTLAPFPAQICDVKTAIRYLRRHAADFHVDPDRMALWGDSSGGHTAVLTALTAHDPHYSDEPVTEELGLRCVVDFYGPSDISRMNHEPSIQNHAAPGSPEGMLIGGRDVLAHPEAVAPTKAASHIRADRPVPPVLIVHGSKDRFVPFGQSVILYEALTAAGHSAQLYQLRGSDHGGPAFWQPAVTDLVDTFLRQHLGIPATNAPTRRA